VAFGKKVPAELEGQFDLVLSSSAFEHYREPEIELQRMRRYVKDGGRIVVTFAEPWYSPSGSHFSGYTRLPGTDIGVPWLNLVFSDQALLALRSKFRKDLPKRIEDVEGGLNRMTVSKFERIIHSCGMEVEQKQLFATKGLPLVTTIPVLREVLTSAASSILRTEAHHEFTEDIGDSTNGSGGGLVG
jgi:SAM-dependent methyltransferase